MSTDLPLDAGMPVIVQATDRQSATRPLASMQRYGTNIVALVTADEETPQPDGLPVFRRFADAVAATSAAACVSFAARHNVADMALEAAQSGIRLIVSVTAGVPIHDTLRVHRHIRDLGATWLNSGTSGLARPSARLLLGYVPETVLRPGDIALITDCVSLGAEAGLQMCKCGLGQSLFIDIGHGPVKGTRMAAMPNYLATDRETRAIALLENPYGHGDDDFYLGIQSLASKKPVMAYIPAGEGPAVSKVDPGDCLLLASAETKAAALAAAGVTVYSSLGALIDALKESS